MRISTKFDMWYPYTPRVAVGVKRVGWFGMGDQIFFSASQLNLVCGILTRQGWSWGREEKWGSGDWGPNLVISAFQPNLAHEHMRVLMTRGYVDDSLLASSGSGVSLAVWNRGSGLLLLADANSVNTNGCRE